MKYTKVKRELFVQTFLEEVDPLYIEGTTPDHQRIASLNNIRSENKETVDAFFKELSDEILTCTADWSTEQVAHADDVLSGKGAPTLSFVRLEQTKRIQKILERGRIRNEDEYYFVRGIVDDSGLDPALELFVQLDELLLEFEESI